MINRKTIQKKLIIALAFFFLVNTGCYKDVEEVLYPTSGPCDVSNITYAATITGIFKGYGCIGCHSGISPSGNIKLDSYAEVKRQVDNGKLYGSISHLSGYSSMPKGGGKMSSCDINKVKAWIDAGAPNN